MHLDADLLEAETLCSEELNEKFQPLFALEKDLFLDITWYLQSIDPHADQHRREVYQRLRSERQEVMYDISGADPSPWAETRR